MAGAKKAEAIIEWIEKECKEMKASGELTVDLPPNFYPFVKPEDPDWHKRYADYNLPGNYHNGGIWPFICGLYIAALVAAKKNELAEVKLIELTKLIKHSRTKELEFGFNEWFKSQDGKPMGQDWQTWSAALYLYAVKCVEEKNTPFFDDIREAAFRQNS
jgi:GH15 family glucan-1,4-alpha-glucosidase